MKKEKYTPAPMNRFIKPIMMKQKPHDFKAWREKRRVIKAMKKFSPDFDIMCEIADFIEMLRDMYMYGNSSQFHLFTATYPKGYTKANCRSMIYKEDSFSITFILFKETREINIEICRAGQSIKSEKEYIRFVDGTYRFKNMYDAEKFLFITASLMNGTAELVEYYYKNKRF